MRSGLAQRFVHVEQRAGNAVPDRAGLAGHAAADRLDVNVESRPRLRHLERLTRDLHEALATESNRRPACC